MSTRRHASQIRSWRVYGGFNASGGLQPSVYIGLNSLAENLVTKGRSHSHKGFDTNLAVAVVWTNMKSILGDFRKK